MFALDLPSCADYTMCNHMNAFEFHTLAVSLFSLCRLSHGYVASREKFDLSVYNTTENRKKLQEIADKYINHPDDKQIRAEIDEIFGDKEFVERVRYACKHMHDPLTIPVREILIHKDEDEVIERLGSIIQKQSNISLEKNELFKIGLSGGSLVTMLPKALKNITTDWDKWRFFFCDERIVPFESNDSTFGAYRKTLIGHFPIEESQFITITPGLSAEEAAKDYIQKMSVYFPPDTLPKFDVLLLGMGPDGHTCSLFPGHRLLNETSVWVAPITDSPKPPPSRITFTFPVLNNAHYSIFPIVGAAKSPMVRAVLKNTDKFPAGNVSVVQPGRTTWILDYASAADYRREF